jgi:UDP-N-acetylmuramoyl-L-alanyl-D-glutamate--2,6-diaminopimelate ligase
VDYAHTPDALEKVLEAVREICKGDIWLVFGLGGDRYKGNRPIMGKIAAQKADRLIITMDNPRSEDPLDIAEAIKKGAAEAGCLDAEIIIDRKDAVYTALDRAKAEDVVLVTGKGPERYIIIGEKLIPYNDMETIEDWGRKRGRTKCLETVS